MGRSFRPQILRKDADLQKNRLANIFSSVGAKWCQLDGKVWVKFYLIELQTNQWN